MRNDADVKEIPSKLLLARVFGHSLSADNAFLDWHRAKFLSKRSVRHDTDTGGLLRCPVYNAERYVYLGSKGLDFLSLSFLFSSPDAILPLFDYIKATGRFVDTLR